MPCGRKKAMNRLQKMAWFNLMIIAISLGLCVGATTVLALLIGMPAALAGFVFMGFGGIIGISPIIFRKRRKPPTFDERDELVNHRAVLLTYSVFWPVFSAVCIIPFLVLGPKGKIPVIVLPLVLCGVMVVLTLVHSTAILIQYGWRNKNNE